MYYDSKLVGSCGATFAVVMFEKRDALNMMQLL